MASREEIKELIKEVLEKGYLMSLGTHDEGGVWVADVIYVYDENLNIYWMSDSESRHSKAIELTSAAAGTITASGPGEHNLGIQFKGVAEKIEGPRWDLAKKHYAKRQKSEPREDEDVLDGDSWYILKPKVFELIHEKHFGFEKQKLEL